MNRQEFQAVLEGFLKAPSPYRHLYVWHGESDQLAALLPPAKTASLDLFDLAANLTRQPLAHEEAQRALTEALRAAVQRWATTEAQVRPVLLVQGSQLLARYSVSLAALYETMTVGMMVLLLCSSADTSYDPAGRLPPYVQCDPAAPLNYLGQLVDDNHVVEA